MAGATLADRSAIALSAFCILHCALLPLFAAGLPFLSIITGIESLHTVSAALAVAISLGVMTFASGARKPRFLVPAVLGVVCLIGGLFADRLGVPETTLTIIGGLLLAAAHFSRLSGHSSN